MHHGCPAGGDDSSRPGACNGRWGVDSSLPVWSYKVLVVTVHFITVQDHWRTLWCEPILETGTDNFKNDCNTEKGLEADLTRRHSLPCGCLQRCWWHLLTWSQRGRVGNQPCPWKRWGSLPDRHPHAAGRCNVQPAAAHRGESTQDLFCLHIRAFSEGKKTFHPDLRYFLNWIHDSMRKLWRWAHKHGSVLVDGSFHGLEREESIWKQLIN